MIINNYLKRCDAGVLGEYVDATSADARAVIVSRGAVVGASSLGWGALTAPQIAAGEAELKALTIIPRLATG